jgi:hypothetical protein
MLVSAGAIEPLTRLSKKSEGEGVGQGKRCGCGIAMDGGVVARQAGAWPSCEVIE